MTNENTQLVEVFEYCYRYGRLTKQIYKVRLDTMVTYLSKLPHLLMCVNSLRNKDKLTGM